MLCPGCRKDSRSLDYCDHCMRPLGGPSAAAAEPLPAPSYAAAATISAPSKPSGLPPPPPPPSGASLGGASLAGPTIESTARPSFAASPPAEPIAAPRMSLTGEAYAPPPPPTAVVQQAPGMPIPPAGGPIPPVAGRTFRQVGLPATAVSAEFMQQASQDEMPFGQRVEKCLAFAMPVLAIAMVIIKLAPQATNGTIMGCLFLWGLAFGASGLAPAYEGAFLDGMIAFVLSFFFGPAIGLLGALGLGMIKQEWSFAALLLGHLLARLVLIIGFPEDAIYFSVMPYAGNMSTMAWMSFGGVCCTYAGWILSSFFRPVNE